MFCADKQRDEKRRERRDAREREVLKKFRKKKVKLESKKKKKKTPSSKCLITQKKTLSFEVVKTNKQTNKQTEKKRKISVYGTEEDPEGEAVEDGGRTMAEQIKASVSKGVDKVKLM